MADIYVQQLTSRGLRNGSSTARGSNHFLSGRGNCDSSRSFTSTLQKSLPPALRSSMGSSRSMRSNSKRIKDNA